MLSSDILEQQFGATKVVIIKQTSGYRIIKTVANTNGQTLELSLVTFTRNTARFPDIHKKIIKGSSIGKAFKQAGVSFVRTVHSITHAPLQPTLQSSFNDTRLATIVDVDIYVGDDMVHYCHIIEIYSSEVDWPQPKTPTNNNDVRSALQHFSELMSD